MALATQLVLAAGEFLLAADVAGSDEIGRRRMGNGVVSDEQQHRSQQN